MGFFKRKDAAPSEEVAGSEKATSEKHGDDAIPRPVGDSEDVSPTDDRAISDEYQDGVAAVEATTLTWSKNHLIAAYAM